MLASSAWCWCIPASWMTLQSLVLPHKVFALHQVSLFGLEMSVKQDRWEREKDKNISDNIFDDTIYKASINSLGFDSQSQKNRAMHLLRNAMASTSIIGWRGHYPGKKMKNKVDWFPKHGGFIIRMYFLRSCAALNLGSSGPTQENGQTFTWQRFKQWATSATRPSSCPAGYPRAARAMTSLNHAQITRPFQAFAFSEYSPWNITLVRKWDHTTSWWGECITAIRMRYEKNVKLTLQPLPFLSTSWRKHV